MRHVLICGVNWIGDSIMSMPALQMLRQRHPDTRLTLLIKPHLVPLWHMHRAPDACLPLATGLAGTQRTGRRLRAERFDMAVVLPHSFRSALLPFLARIPERRGMSGHARDMLLTHIITLRPELQRSHQAYEYVNLFWPGAMPATLPPPVLEPPPEVRAAVTAGAARWPAPRIALLPGAARGPAKQWPVDHFVAVARAVRTELGGSVLLFGGPADAPLGARLGSALADGPVGNWVGQTTLPEWAAWLGQCQAAVANDSGGMHLAAAMGTPVVALFGLTDPAKTGPLGSAHRILQQAAGGHRDIPRASAAAAAALAAIPPAAVVTALREMLTAQPPAGS